MAGKSVNKVILIGNVGKDPEITHSNGGMTIAKFSIATNERFKDKDGQWQDRTEWHNLVAFQRLAEIAGEYLKKGGKCYVEGSLKTSQWDDKQSGQKKYKTEIVVNDLVLLGGSADSADRAPTGRGQKGGGPRDNEDRPIDDSSDVPF